MKKLITLFVLLFTITLSAQIGSASTNINIVLSEVYSIEVLQSNVNLIIDEASDIPAGTSTVLNNHIRIISNVDYEVSIAVNQNYTNGTDDIPVDKVTLKLLDGATLINSIPLSLSGNIIIPLSNPTATRNINAEYILEGGDHLLVSAGTYTATATLTLTPQ